MIELCTVRVIGRLPNLSNERMHWRPKAQLVQRIRQHCKLIALSERHARRLDVADSSREVAIRVFARPPLWDVSNIPQNCKPYLDGLVDSGLIEHDRDVFPTYQLVKLPSVSDLSLRAPFNQERVELTIYLP